MPKYVIGLVVLGFVAGAGMTAIILKHGGLKKQTPITLAQASQNAEATETEVAKAEQEEKTDDLDGPYGDPATCDALLNAQTYAKDKDFMFMLPGKQQWVFRTRQDLQMSFDIKDKDIDLYKKFADVLKSKGTELVMAYIPPRGMIATEYLPQENEITEDYDAQSARENYTALIEKMNSAGIRFVGTANPEIGSKYFNHADQHWTTAGAHEMAMAIANFVKTQPVSAVLRHQEFKTEVGEAVEYDGRFGEFIKDACGFRPSPETDFRVKTEAVNDEDTEAALLGDTAMPEVVLVGTSNSIRDEFNSNFDGYLKETMSVDVYNAAISGGGMDDSLLAFFASEQYQKSPPKLMIWELPGYYDLGGEGMEDALRQGIASVAGYCTKPLKTFDLAQIVGKKVYLFDDLSDLNIGAETSYIAIKFEKPVAKDFSISIKTTDKKNQKFKFKKRREGNSNLFFYLPEGDNTMLSSVALNVNKSIDGLMMEARLCPLPPVGATP